MKLSNGSMLHHLSKKHPELEKGRNEKDIEINQQKRKREEETGFLELTKRQRLLQPTLQQVQEKCKLWDINDPRAEKITRLIGKSLLFLSILFVYVT